VPFGTPQLLTALNSPASDEDPTLSEDERTLIFVSDRPTGDRNLYLVQKVNGVFGSPQRLDALNSSADERTPVLSRDGRRLYFGSDRESPLNDHDGDILITERADSSSAFGTPVNVSILNSTGTEFPVAIASTA
jgi:Tol biopolymer transport system component